MLIKPLDLGPRVQHVALPILTGLARPLVTRGRQSAEKNRSLAPVFAVQFRNLFFLFLRSCQRDFGFSRARVMGARCAITPPPNLAARGLFVALAHARLLVPW